MDSKPLHPALKELYDIIKEPDWTDFARDARRKEMLDKWRKAWVTEVEFSQSVVDTNYLNSEYNDLIKYKLAQSLSEDLAETCTIFTTDKKKISAKVCAFRRQAKVRRKDD